MLGFNDLPTEIIIYIFSKISIQDSYQLSQTNTKYKKIYQQLVNEENYYHYLT